MPFLGERKPDFPETAHAVTEKICSLHTGNPQPAGLNQEPSYREAAVVTTVPCLYESLYYKIDKRPNPGVHVRQSATHRAFHEK